MSHINHKIYQVKEQVINNVVFMHEPIHNNKESDGIHEQNLSFFVALDNLIILTSYSTHVASKL